VLMSATRELEAKLWPELSFGLLRDHGRFSPALPSSCGARR
jgi:hypothetical protein